MPFIPAETLLAALKDKIGAILLDPQGGDEPLFQRVDTYGDKRLGVALRDLVITQDRLCLAVPTGVRRIHDDGGAYVTSKKYLEVDLLIADRAFVRAGQAGVLGSERNPGTIKLAERLEEALMGADLSEYGPAIFDDGAQQEITAEDAKTMPGRPTWIQTLLIPAGVVATPTI